MLQWRAGDLHGAIGTHLKIRERHPGTAPGRTAAAHIAVRLESQCVIEAESVRELRDCLEAAAEYYRMTVEETPGVPPHLTELAREGLSRLEQGTELLERALQERKDYVAASEIISDLGAERVSALILGEFLSRGEGDPAHLLFLMLVHEMEYLDAMAERLTESDRMLREDYRGFFIFGIEKYAPRMSEGVRRALEISSRSLLDHPLSPWMPDIRAHRAQAYLLRAMLHMTLRTDARVRADLPAARRELDSVIADLELAREANAELIAILHRMAARHATSILMLNTIPRELYTLRRLLMAAAERELTCDRLIAIHASQRMRENELEDSTDAPPLRGDERP